MADAAAAAAAQPAGAGGHGEVAAGPRVGDHADGPRLKKGDRVVYKPVRGRNWRAALVTRAGRTRNGTRTFDIKLFGRRPEVQSLCEVGAELVMKPSVEEGVERKEEWEALEGDPPADEVPGGRTALYRLLQQKGYKANRVGKGQVRIATFNVMHYGAAGEKAEARLDERTRNLVEVIHQSRCALVVLQEVSKSADTELLCRLLDERSKSTRWRCTPVVDKEHAMLYRSGELAEFLGCEPEALRVESCAYQHREVGMSRTFWEATRWGGWRRHGAHGSKLRRDFSMQGASAARLPALFFVHNGLPASEPAFRSIAVCSVHFAYGLGGVSDTRELQMKHAGSLMPGAGYDATRCLFALMGDMNSGASVAQKKEGGGVDFADSGYGRGVMRGLNESSPGHVLALGKGERTTVANQRYDEAIVHGGALGCRHAHVHPKRECIPSGGGLAKLFSDHLLVFVDLAFPSQLSEGGCRLALLTLHVVRELKQRRLKAAGAAAGEGG